MPIDALTSVALAQIPTFSAPSDVSVAILDKQLEVTQQMGADMVKAMEHSVNPAIGGNIDISI